MSNKVKATKRPETKKFSADKVIVGYLHPGMVHGEFMRSIINLIAYDAVNGRHLVDGGGFIEYQAGANLSGPRNELVRRFMALGSADWLLMVDSDMVFDPWALDQLLSKADRDERPIVGGLCFGLEADGTHSPTLFDVIKGENGEPVVGRYREWSPGELMKVGGTGTAFLLIHRSVFEKFDSFEAPTGTTAFTKTYPYFQETEYLGKPIGEDLTFCFRAAYLGIPTHVDTSLHIGHVKSRVLNFQSYVAEYQALRDRGSADEASD